MEGTGDGGVVALGAPAPVDGIALVVVAVHVLGVHAGHVEDAAAVAVVELHVGTPAAIVEAEAEAARHLGVAVAQIDDVELVDVAVVVDVLVDGIAPLELVADVVVVEHHREGLALLVDDDASVGITGHGGVLLLTGDVVAVLIDALVAEAVDGAEGVGHLHAGEVRAVGEVEVAVEAHQRSLVHADYLVDVVAEGEVEAGLELTKTDNLVAVHIEFPALIAHGADILPRKGRETRGGGDTDVAHQQVVGELVIDVDVHREFVVPEADVGADVPGGLRLPAEVGEADVVGTDSRHVDVLRVASVAAEVEVLGTWLLAHLSPARTEGEHGEPGARPTHPRLVADVPTAGDGGEEAPTVVGAKLGAAVKTGRDVEGVLRLVAVVT